MKVAIIGAGPGGLACALECEKLGVIPDVYERDYSVGWAWPSANYLPSVLYRNIGDPAKYVKNKFNIEIASINECKTIILKSEGQEIKIKGKMGAFVCRGKGNDSVENQLLQKIKKTAIHYNHLANYKELALNYDYVVVASGRDTEARELKVWEDQGIVHIIGGLALGNFDDETAILYLNTEYAGSGYARITPFSQTQAIVALDTIGKSEFEIDRLFAKFLKIEKLEHLEFLYKFTPPPFTTGYVRKFKIGNILLVGRAAGLTERFIGVGGAEAAISGVLAARAMILDEDYDELVKPIQKHIENISAFRKIIDKFENKDFDRLLSLLGTPGVKEIVYNTPINFADALGALIKKLQAKK